MKASAKFQISKSSDGQFFFNLIAANGEVVVTSEMYASLAMAKKGISAVKRYAKTAKVVVAK